MIILQKYIPDLQGFITIVFDSNALRRNTLRRLGPPGIPHAVYTPVDFLVVGVFFLSPSNVPMSLRVLQFLEVNPHCTNDDATMP